jgi:hypothetical protein
MNKRNENKRVTDLTQKITDHIKELAQATDKARMSQVMQDYLAFCARFHQYSLNNQWLIWLSMPEAIHVAGYCKWKELGRYVKKGEKGIPILAPIIKKNEDHIEEVVNFKVVYVFDISQTDGEPLPEQPDWISSEKDELLQERLIAYATSMGIQVKVIPQKGDIQGVSKGGEIELSPDAGTKTLIHEIAHEIMHKDEEEPCSRALRELEAESVSHVVARYFGIQDLNSPNYTALWGGDAETILKHLDRIRETASEVINGVEGGMQP